MGRYLGELVDFVLSLEEGLFFQKFAEYAADAPQIDLGAVRLRP